uniref:Uncharacterized protein n=1 Tax=Arundo donax TaxID=35708 RepID=A0A0A8YI00_ARUDO
MARTALRKLSAGPSLHRASSLYSFSLISSSLVGAIFSSISNSSVPRLSACPSKRALQTSSFVASSALSIIAMFCDFFGLSTLFSWLHKFAFAPLIPFLDDLLVEFETNNVSIISSFTLNELALSWSHTVGRPELARTLSQCSGFSFGRAAASESVFASFSDGARPGDSSG